MNQWPVVGVPKLESHGSLLPADHNPFVSGAVGEGGSVVEVVGLGATRVGGDDVEVAEVGHGQGDAPGEGGGGPDGDPGESRGGGPEEGLVGVGDVEGEVVPAPGEVHLEVGVAAEGGGGGGGGAGDPGVGAAVGGEGAGPPGCAGGRERGRVGGGRGVRL